MIALTNFDILKIFGTYKKVFIVFVFLSIFCIIQICRKQEIKYYLLFNKQPAILQCALLAIIIYICIFNVFSSEYLAGIVDNGAQFIKFIDELLEKEFNNV